MAINETTMTQTATGTARYDSQGAFRFDMRQDSPFFSRIFKEENAGRKNKEEHDAIRCRLCMHPVTERIFKSRKNGQFSHICTNPAGISFSIGIFSRAPGCTVFGPATEEHTWFKGYAWQTALCANCLAHLGWHFISGGDDLFFGLILQNLSIP